jgi:hypothetical protein
MKNSIIIALAIFLGIAPLHAAMMAASGDPHPGNSLPNLKKGRLQGTVILSGQYAPPPALKVIKSRNFCGSTVPNETLLVSRDGGVRNAVIIMHPQEHAEPVQPRRIFLDNQRCAFVPHVQVAPLGSELVLKNSDPILHTVHARMGKDTLFNVGLPRWRQVSKMLDRVGIIRIDCDVLHTWMSAAITVVSTPYFAVTDEKGLFAIDGLPPGMYTVEVWHERLGFKTARISLADGAVRFLDVVYGNSAR